MDDEEIRLLRNEYQRNWRTKNQDKVKAINKRFYSKQKLKKIKKQNQDYGKGEQQ